MKRITFRAFCALAIFVMANAAYGDSRLLYAEAQLVAGYNFAKWAPREVYFYSMDQMDVMQKPSIGFDLVQRLSTGTGDWGVLAVQARLAYDKTHNGNVEPQLYNAFLKVKPGFGDVWIGHNKPAFGLASYLDNHGALLQPLAMSGLEGYNFDRDWGVGFYRDFDWGNATASATIGSGMPLVMRGNRLFSVRMGFGDLNQRNYTVGLSAAYGKTLNTMGYHVDEHLVPAENYLLGTDAAYNWNRFENKLEIIWQRYPSSPVVMLGHSVYAFYRITLNLLDDNRLKTEFQIDGGYNKIGAEWDTKAGYHFFLNDPSLCFSFNVTNELTARIDFMNLDFAYPYPKVVTQLYWYHKI